MSTFANVYTGAAPNDGTGTPLRNAFQIIDLNFANIANGSANITISSPVNSVAGRQGNVLLSVDDVYGAVGLDYVDAALVASNVYLTGLLDSFTSTASDTIYNSIADNLATTISDQAEALITSSHVLDPLTGFEADLTAANVNIQNISDRLSIATDDITSLISGNVSSYSKITTLTGNVATLTANAGVQGHSINTINSTLADINNSIDSIGNSIDDINYTVGVLSANASTQSQSINIINANLGTATNNISTLLAANVVQENKLATLRTDLSAANLAIVNLNNSFESQLTANINSVNASISTANNNIAAVNSRADNLVSNAVIQSNQINAINANVASANVAIQSIYDRQEIADHDITTLIGYNANVGAYQIYANANIGAFYTYANTTNASTQGNLGAFQIYANTQVQTINANLGAFQTFANANSATQQTQITSLYTSANANTAAYLATASVTTTGNITAGFVRSNGNIAMTSNIVRNVYVANVAPISSQGNVGDIWYQTF